MAITKGIDEGDVLLKFTQMARRPQRDRETGRMKMVEMEVPYFLKLYTRRARTNGSHIEPWMKPFMEAINVRLVHDYGGVWRAVGVLSTPVTQEQWDSTPISAVADKRYQRMLKNEQLAVLITKEAVVDIESLRAYNGLAEDETDDDEWDEEPNLPRYDLETGHRLWY